MAIINLPKVNEFKKLKFKKIFTLSLHIAMLLLCIIGSIVFLQ